MADYRANALAYLRHVIEQTGLNATALAARVGVSHTTLTRPLNNPDYLHAIKYGTLQKIAAATSIPLPVELTGPENDTLTTANVKPLVVRGVVAAGMWQSVEDVDDGALGTIPVVEDGRYAGFTQWAELVRGPSMNRTYPDGDYLHLVDAGEISYSPIAGDDVVVERREDQRIERTCKRIAMLDSKFVLVGDSLLEKWNAPLPYDDTAENSMTVIGLVIGSYRPRRR